MRMHRVLPLVLAGILPAGTVIAQGLRDLLPDFVGNGIRLLPGPICPPDNPTSGNCHDAHFEGAAIAEQVRAFQTVSTSISQQLASFPLPSSTGGFTYTYDPTAGTFQRGSDSFGPIYAERADTIGKGHFSFGVNYSHFSYDAIDDLSLDDGEMRLLLLHATRGSNDFENPWFRGDVVDGALRINAKSDIVAFTGNWGVTNQFDVGFAVPISSVSLNVESDLAIDRLSTFEDPDVHLFNCDAGGVTNCTGNTATLTNSGSASGLGDVLLRLKYRFTSSPKVGVALGTDFRFPTGDEEDLLGTGVMQIRAFAIGSAHIGIFSPHINAGYTWAIHRCLGLADPPDSNNSPRDLCESTGTGGVSDEVNYTAGFDLAIGSRVTFAADLIGRTFLNTKAVALLPRTLTYNINPDCAAPAPPPCANPILETTVKPFVGTEAGETNINTLTGSVGFKVNPFGNFLINVNGLFSLNNQGLQDSFTPMVAIDYTF